MDFLQSLSHIFLTVVFPVFFVALVGFLIARVTHVDARGISGLLIYGLTPLFIIDRLSRPGMLESVDFGQILVFLPLHTLAMGVIGYGCARLLGLRGGALKAFLLTILIPNAGNYPIPVNDFAYGMAGEAAATCAMVPNVALTMTLGVYLATGDRSPRESLLAIVKLPMIYALVLVAALRGLDINLHESVFHPGIAYAAGAALPLNLMQLGIVLAAGFRRRRDAGGEIGPPEPAGRMWGTVGAAVAVKLLVAPAVAAGILAGLGVEGQLFKSLMILAAMPAAVYTVILSSFFRTDSRVVAVTVTAGTLLSLPTVTVVLALLERYAP